MMCHRCGEREVIRTWSNIISILGCLWPRDPGEQRAPMHPGPLCLECVIEQLGSQGPRIAAPLRKLTDGKITFRQFLAAVQGNQSDAPAQ